MQLIWELPARMFTEQLSQLERAKVRKAIEGLSNDWDPDSPHLKLINRGEEEPIYLFKTGMDFRAVLKREDAKLIVIDVVRRSQIDSLRTILQKRR